MRNKQFETITIAIDSQGNRHIIGTIQLNHAPDSCWLTSSIGKETFSWDYGYDAEIRQEEAMQMLEVGILDFEKYFVAQSSKTLLRALADMGLSNTEIVAFVQVNANHSGVQIRWLECEVVSATGTISKMFNLFHVPNEFNYLSVDDIASMIIDGGLGDFQKLIGKIQVSD